MAFHSRSNSFPSRPHPVLQQVDQHLCRLRSSSDSTSTSSSSSSIAHHLSSLQDLHDCVDRMLQLPLTQQALAQEPNEKSTNEILDGSLRLLDVCGTAKDAVLQTKECVKDLQSIMRRTRGDDKCGALTIEVKKYLSSRKIVKKAIHKAMPNLKGSTVNKDNHDTISIISKLREVEAVTSKVLESHLSFISGPKSESFISKMMQSKRVAACEEETQVNEFAKVDAALHSNKTSKCDVDNLESCIQDQEQQLECLFRQLIKTRVSLLNILNH